MISTTSSESSASEVSEDISPDLPLVAQIPSAVILAKACLSAEHETAIATGQLAPWRGSLASNILAILPAKLAPIRIRVSSESVPPTPDAKTVQLRSRLWEHL